MATKKTYEAWCVYVNRNDGLSFEKLEKDFDWISYSPKIYAPDGVTEIFEKKFKDDLELSDAELKDLNGQSEFNGIRYYAKG